MPALGEVRTVTIIRRHNPIDFFADHGMELFESIPKTNLRMVRFLPTLNAVFPTDFLDDILSCSPELVILDIRWPLSYTHPFPVAIWRTSIRRTITSITVAVQCVSRDCVAQVTGEILASCPNLTYLFASCCAHPRTASMPDLFDVTAQILRSRGVRLRLRQLDLIGCPNHRNVPNRVCDIFRNIVDFSLLDILALQAVMSAPIDFLVMIANLNQGRNIREVFIRLGNFPRSLFFVPWLPNLHKFTITT